MIPLFIRTILIYFLLTFLMKILGKRQIGELEANELVSTLLISEIASGAIGDADAPLINTLVPIILICCIEVIAAWLKNKNTKLKRVMEGEPIYLIYKGKLKQKVLLENRISINEVLTEMRTQGIGDIKDIRYGILEQNGKLSLLKSDHGGGIAHTLVIDGRTDEKTLKELGYSDEWLRERLKERRIKKDEIFLFTLDDDGAFNIIRKEERD